MLVMIADLKGETRSSKPLKGLAGKDAIGVLWVSRSNRNSARAMEQLIC
jgi:hypothetical protein